MADQATENASAVEDQSSAGGDNTENNQNSSNDPFKDLLGGITNEDGTQKYSSVETALNSMSHAQEHISTIEAENAALKDELAKSQAKEDLLRKSVNNQKPEQTPLTADQLNEAISVALDAKSEAAQKEANLNSVRKVFSDTYGEKAGAEMQSLADANGVSLDFMKSLSETSPRAALQLAGLSDKGSSSTIEKSRGSFNTESLDSSRQNTESKPVMGASSTKELLNAWNRIGDNIRNQT